MKPSVTNEANLRQGKILGLNPNVFFLGMLGIVALIRE